MAPAGLGPRRSPVSWSGCRVPGRVSAGAGSGAGPVSCGAVSAVFGLAGSGGGGGPACWCRRRVVGPCRGLRVLWVAGVAGVTGWFLGVRGGFGVAAGCFGPLGRGFGGGRGPICAGGRRRVLFSSCRDEDSG